jgi:hypothetical protein
MGGAILGLALVTLGACRSQEPQTALGLGWSRVTFDSLFAVDLPDSLARAEVGRPSDLVITPTMPAGEGFLTIERRLIFGWRWYRHESYRGDRRRSNSARGGPQFRSLSPHGEEAHGLVGFTSPEGVYEASVTLADAVRMVVVWVHPPLVTDSTATAAILSSVRLLPREP